MLIPTALLFSLLLTRSNTLTHAFVHRSNVLSYTNVRSSTDGKRILAVTSATADIMEEVDRTESKKSMATLDLFGQVTSASESAPAPSNNLQDYFSLPESPLIILRGANNNSVVENSNPDDTLLQLYADQCKKIEAQPPTPQDRIFDVTTSGVSFPGLKVNTVATIGVKIIVDNNTTMPSYENVLIRDSTYAEGNRILLWFFNKVTGKGKKDVKKTTTQSTQSLSTIRAIPVGDGTIAFEANACLRVRVKFPSLLMKMIPDGKAQSERTGGESLRKALEGDIPTALENFRYCYVQWLER